MKNDTQVKCENVHSAIQDTLYVVNGKWKLVILSILVNNGTKRFGELSRESGISPRILSKELNELEMNQLNTAGFAIPSLLQLNILRLNMQKRLRK
jgi:DNA-binding HxlR family transcriptional regulator